jgi:hypothetical protein
MLAPRHVYQAKTARWQQQWPSLTVLPWPRGAHRPVDVFGVSFGDVGEGLTGRLAAISRQAGLARTGCPVTWPTSTR